MFLPAIYVNTLSTIDRTCRDYDHLRWDRIGYSRSIVQKETLDEGSTWWFANSAAFCNDNGYEYWFSYQIDVETEAHLLSHYGSTSYSSNVEVHNDRFDNISFIY